MNADYTTYLNSLNFENDDLICLVTIDRNDRIDHSFVRFGQLKTEDTVKSLTRANSTGEDIYLCMSPLKDGANSRSKPNVGTIRHAYVDIDENGVDILNRIKRDVDAGVVPPYNLVIESSPSKFQIIWSVEGLTVDQQETLNKSLQTRYGTDPATTDAVRILRVPGFINCKYDSKPVAKIVTSDKALFPNSLEDFKIELVKNVSDGSSKTALPRNSEGKIPHGHLYHALISEAGSLRQRGYSVEAIETALVAWADENCEQPLDYDKIKGYARAAEKWEQGNPSKMVYSSQTAYGVPPAQVSGNEQDEEDLDLVIEEEKLPPFPKFFGPLHDFAMCLCPDIPYEFKFMAAVTHFGVLRSGLDKLEDYPTLQPRFYTCFVAEPGRGKTAAINEVRIAFGSLTSQYSCVSSIDSGPALVDEFSERHEAMLKSLNPPEGMASRVLLDPDEMKDLFEKSKITSTGRNTLFSELLKLYEGNRTGNRSRRAGKSQVENAHLAILGGATPEGYQTMWTGTSGGSTGLQSRFITIATDAPRMPINARRSCPEITKVIPLMLAELNKPARDFKTHSDAECHLADWWSKTLRDKHSETRIGDMVKRMALVLAASHGSQIVSPEIMAVSIEFGDYLIACRERFNPADSSSWTQAFENLILTTARRFNKPLTERDFRRIIHPERKPGGLGPFIQAMKNCVTTESLKKIGETRKKQGLYVAD